MRDGEDPKTRMIAYELESFFENEIVDDRLDGVTWTGFDLSADLRHLTIRFLPSEGREAAADDGVAALWPRVCERLDELLSRTPEVRFVLDRGAANQRRVEQILEELAEQPKSVEDEDQKTRP